MQSAAGQSTGNRAEWVRLLDRAGVNLVEVVNLASFGKLLVLRPRAGARRADLSS